METFLILAMVLPVVWMAVVALVVFGLKPGEDEGEAT